MENKLIMMRPHKEKKGYVGLVKSGNSSGGWSITYTAGYPFYTHAETVYKKGYGDKVRQLFDLYYDMIDEDYERKISWESFKKLVVMRKKMDKYCCLAEINKILKVS